MCSLLLSASALLVFGCGDDEATTSTTASDGLIVTVEPASAPPGSTVHATVRNETDEQFTYGAGYTLERLSGDTWEEVELPPRPVPEIGYVAPPGESGPPVEVILPEDLEPGTYRVVLDGPGALTGEFEVTDG